MAKDETGYRKPPQSTRFKKGVCPNPLGRGAKKAPSEIELVRGVLNAMTEYTEGGKLKRVPRIELIIKGLVDNALKGNVSAATSILALRTFLATNGDVNPVKIFMPEGMRNI